MSLIQLQQIYKIYNEGRENEVRALNGVTLSIDRGEFVAIIGSSGSGKSTLMNVLGCLDLPSRGSYSLNGKLASRMSDDELSRIRNVEIGFIFQGYNLIPALSVDFAGVADIDQMSHRPQPPYRKISAQRRIPF